jgi:biofilm PGA synthesis N-glycosyltransferase PgaC
MKYLDAFKAFPDYSRADKGSAVIYVAPKFKMVLSALFVAAWLAISIYIARPWITDLGSYVPLFVAWFMVTGLALIPGMANALVVSGLVLDKRPIFIVQPKSKFPPVSMLIAAYNEEKDIASTLHSVLTQNYPAMLEVIVIDDGSKDNTAQIVSQGISENKNPNVKIILNSLPQNKGKANALNAGLKLASYDYIITLDADSYLYENSLLNLVNYMLCSTPDTAAVAGSVLVRNSRDNWLTKLQEWDYFLGISVVKRIQSLYQGTLVAQGAYSIFEKAVLQECGGWTDTMGEDIVLTWGLHSKGYKVGYAENAFIFTNVPETYMKFFRQRKRWARGLIEAFIKHPDVLVRPRLNLPFIWYNLTFPYLDSVYLFVFIPGVIAAVVFHNYLLVGLLTLLLLPLAMLINGIMYYKQKQVFKRMGLQIRQNLWGFFVYMVGYQLIMTPASLAGYAAEMLRLKKNWGTK